MKPHSKVWPEPPQLALPENPAFVSHCDTAWLAYEIADSIDNIYAVIRFDGLIDFHMSPINDEGLGAHPYARTGIKPYEFNELFGTRELQKWADLETRQFAITFKDVTIDIIARAAVVLHRGFACIDAHTALLTVARSPVQSGG